MLEGMLARMVARAMPPHITDSDQERIAAEAAENAIRQTAWFAGILGVILLALAGGMLYRSLPGQQSSQGPSEPSKAAIERGAEESNLRQENEDLQKKLDDVTKEFQGKMTALEGQVADLTAKLHAAQNLAASEQRQAEAAKEKPESLRQMAGSSGMRVSARPPGAYQCGNGRTARDPARCQNTASPAASAVRAAPPGVYQCGDGRTARDPAGCKSSASPAGG
jgi:hypothetical protein